MIILLSVLTSNDQLLPSSLLPRLIYIDRNEHNLFFRNYKQVQKVNKL